MSIIDQVFGRPLATDEEAQQRVGALAGIPGSWGWRRSLLLKKRYPDRQLAVIVPELVEYRWYDYLLHNQRATVLKTFFAAPRRQAGNHHQRALVSVGITRYQASGGWPFKKRCR